MGIAFHNALCVPDEGRFRTDRPGSDFEPAPNGSKVSEIVSPAFELIAVAKQSGRLDELRKRLETISDTADPNQLRAKVALLFMVRVAQKDAEATAESLMRLTELVKTRGNNQAGRWWPETLALAFGMEQVPDMIEMNDLAATMFHVQIGQSRWSGSMAWDVFVSNCFAQFKASERPSQNIEAKSTDAFREWIPSEVVTAESRGTGCPPAVWRHAGNLVHKLNGHSSDYLYFPIPLTGDFEVECDVTSFNYRETQMAYAGQYASHNWRLTEAEIGELQHISMIPLTPKMIYPDDWLTCRIAVRNNACTYYINGRQLSRRELKSNQFPWLAMRTYRISHGSIRNVTISGNPIIPKIVSMCSGTDLNGWTTYFDAAIDGVNNGSQASDWRTVDGDDSEREILHPKRPDLAGTQAESLLMYHRPMAEDGVIEYEFFYTPNMTLVHPAIDRLAFLLTLDGVQTHYVTDGPWQPDALTPDNHVVETTIRQGSKAMPLKPNSWNHLQFALQGNLVQLNLNGTNICECEIDESNRRQFGLFHFADQSSVRVRRMQWHGSWPVSIDSPGFPPAACADVASIEAATRALPQSLHHDLRESKLPEAGFIKKAARITATPDGVFAECVGEGRRQSDLAVSLEIGGDFDIRAAFRNLQHSDEGDAGLEMAATLEKTNQQIRLALNRFQRGDRKMKTQIGGLLANGRWDYADTWRVCEATEGVLRMVRLGKTLHFLFAESETSTFRLLHSATVGTENLRLGDTVISVFANNQATSSCLWTSFSAEQKHLPARLGLITRRLCPR